MPVEAMNLAWCPKATPVVRPLCSEERREATVRGFAASGSEHRPLATQRLIHPALPPQCSRRMGPPACFPPGLELPRARLQSDPHTSLQGLAPGLARGSHSSFRWWAE